MFPLFSGVHHDGIENPANQQNDQEVDQREGCSRTKVKLTDCHPGQELAEEGGCVTRTATGEDERFGIDHETVHEAQQNTDHENRLHLGQLNEAEHGPARCTVNLGRLIIGIRD